MVSVASGELIGINNTGNDNGADVHAEQPVRGRRPTAARPPRRARRYGQETYWFNTCLNASRTIDLNIAGCLLTKPPGSGTTIYSDTFETATGWTANPNGTDTATTGQWVRADPAGTTSGGVTLQLGTTVSGTFDLVTGSAAGSSRR